MRMQQSLRYFCLSIIRQNGIWIFILGRQRKFRAPTRFLFPVLFNQIYEGDFKDTGNGAKTLNHLPKAKDMKSKKWFMWYTTCPKCAKKIRQKLLGNYWPGNEYYYK
jgi:hypothetical protein